MARAAMILSEERRKKPIGKCKVIAVTKPAAQL